MKKKYLPITILSQFIAVAAFGQSTFNYTGAVQTYTVPTCVFTITVDARGGAGGMSGAANPGLGGRVQATLSVTPGEVLNIYVGGAGSNTGTPGGWNGGGISSAGTGPTTGASGGGASDIRRGGTALSNRILVAGGGGGTGTAQWTLNHGGGGGGLNGTNGVTNGTYTLANCGAGASQTAGGAGANNSPSYTGTLGQGGNGGPHSGGGGGGRYGGGGGTGATACCTGGGGGGGSGYAEPTATAVTQTNSYQAGNGQIIITPIVSTGPAQPGTITGSSSVCANSTVAYSISNVPNATTYNWTYPSGSTISGQGLSSVSITFGTASGNITVTASNSCGTSAQRTMAVTVNPAPASPTAGSNSPLCQGTTLNLTASTVAGATYSWTGPNGFMSNAQNPSVSSVSTSDAGTYSVTITSGGCMSAPATTNVVVNPAPAPPTAGSNSPLCDGTTLNLSASMIAGATYSWTGPNGFTSTDQNPVISNASASEAGTYSVTVIVGGCTSSPATTAVVVNPIPSPPTAGNNSPLCEGTTLNLTASTVTGATYWWTGPNFFSSSAQNPSIPNITSADAGTYSVTITVDGCTSVPATTTVMTNPAPPPPTAGNDSPLCDGTTLNLTADMVAGATYTWSGPNSFSSNLQNPSISPVTANDAGTYSVTVTLNGCASQPATTNVIINSAVVPIVTPTGQTTFCEGGNVDLVSSVAEGYLWSEGTMTQSLQVTETGNYSVTISDANGCIATSSPVTITVNPNPVVTFTGLNGGYCLTNPATALTGNPSGGIFTGPGISGNTFDPSLAGVGSHTITYLFTDANGCSGSVSQATIISNNAFVTLGPDTMVCDNAPAFVLNPGNFSTYQWQDNSSGSSFSVNPPALGIGLHTFYVAVTDANSCSGMDSIVVDVSGCMGGAVQTNEISLVILPNPSDGMVQLQFGNISGPVLIEVMNLQGEIIERIPVIVAGNSLMEMDLSGVAKGLYYVRATNEVCSVLNKIILK